MHTVMWEGANFTPISMSQILLPEKVKTYYRKAMLVGMKEVCDVESPSG